MEETKVTEPKVGGKRAGAGRPKSKTVVDEESSNKAQAGMMKLYKLALGNLKKDMTSSDEKIRQEGLDDLGYILPVFMINNMKGEEILVYLKAKLEAAKEVQGLEEKEVEAEKKEEEFIEVEKPKAEEKEKVMEMKQELEEKESGEKQAEDKQATENKETPSKD